MIGFSRFKIFRALMKDKTVMNFQYVNGEGNYVGNGSIGEMLDFSAGAIAKICIQAGDQLDEDGVKDILRGLRKQVLEMYRKYKETGCQS